MAKSMRQMQGWHYILGCDLPSFSGEETPRRMSRRGAGSKRNKSQIILRREMDDFEIKEGDFILVDKPDALFYLNEEANNNHGDAGDDLVENISNLPSVALIKEISFGTDRFIVVKVFWFYRYSEINRNLVLPFKDTDQKYILNDVFLTPLIGSIQLEQILGGCKVISGKSLKKIVVDDSNSDSLFVCRRFCDDEGCYFTDVIDWDEMYRQFEENSDEFYHTLKTVTIKPTLKKFIKSLERKNIDPRSLESSPSKKIAKKRQKEKEKSVKLELLGEDDSDISGLDDDMDDNYLAEEHSDNDSLLDEEDDEGSEDEAVDDDEKDGDFMKVTKRKYRTRSNVYGSPSPSKKNKTNFDKIFPTLPVVSRKLQFGDDVADVNSEIKHHTTKSLHKAKRMLGIGAKIKSLPCREEEFHQLYNSLENSVMSKQGCCLYVSGTPGVGKTATIREVIKQLSAKLTIDNNGDRLFNYLEINGLKLISPQAAYEVLWKKISGKQASSQHSLSLLESFFESAKTEDKRLPLVVLLDELDQIVTKNQSVMYNFFNWPSYTNSKLIVIAVANTMDLPERLLTNKISSRLGLTRIQFTSYTYAQLSEIIRHRLENLSKTNDKLIVAKDAIEFASRKVASVSGDARRSLMICIRAVEIAESEFMKKSKNERDKIDGKYTVTIMHVMRAVNETASSPISNYLNSLSFLGKMVLAAIMLRKKRTGLADILMGEVIDELNNLFETIMFTNLKNQLNLEDLEFLEAIYGKNKKSKLRVNGSLFILKDLEENGILILQSLKMERLKLLRLNVSEDEILNCFKKDPLMKDMITYV